LRPEVARSLAAATVRIHCGNSLGSGFHFIEPDVVVTAAHVVEHDLGSVMAEAEDGSVWDDLTYVTHSSSQDNDFALFRINGEVGADRVALNPGASPTRDDRGREVFFAGFPHGTEDLLVQAAIISGFTGEWFYLDGSVNAGNSGGPAIDAETEALLGIVTASRFLYGEDLRELAQAARYLAAQAERAKAQEGGMNTINLGGMVIEGMDFGGGPAIGGINFNVLADLVSKSNQLLERAFEANANTGLGVALGIDLVADVYRQTVGT
jgi:Trypsin-like peptidase domain